MRKRLRKKLERHRIAQKFQAFATYVVEESVRQGARWLHGSKRERRAALMALLFKVDLEAYAQHGQSITGMDWIKGREFPEPRFPRFNRGAAR